MVSVRWLNFIKFSHALVIYWLKAFRERGLDGVKSPHTNPQNTENSEAKDEKKDIEIPETTDVFT